MSENNTGQVSDETTQVSDEGNKVSYDKYAKLLGQRKADQEKLRELEEWKASIETERQKQEESKLEEEGKWREAYEMKNKTIEELKSKLTETEQEKTQLSKTLVDSAKLQAVVQTLPGQIKRPEYYKFIDTNSVIVDPETGDFDSGSVESVANNFLKEYGKDLLAVKKEGRLPHDSPNAAGNKISLAEYKKLARTNPKEAKKALSENRVDRKN